MIKLSPKVVKGRTNRLPAHFVDGANVITVNGMTRYYRLPLASWSFVESGSRQLALESIAHRVTALVDRQGIHLRVTSVPFSVGDWQRQLLQRSPGAMGEFSALVSRQAARAMEIRPVQKAVYIGVPIEVPPNTLERFRAKRDEWEATTADIRKVDRLMEAPGFSAVPATPVEMDMLFRTSVGLLFPATVPILPASSSLDADALNRYSDAVTVEGAVGQRYLKLTGSVRGQEVTRYLSIMTLGRMPEQDSVYRGERSPWIMYADRFPFPVEWSIRFDVINGRKAAKSARAKMDEITYQQRDYAEHGEPLTPEMAETYSLASHLRDKQTTGMPVDASEVRGFFRLAVAASDVKTLEDRVQRIRREYEEALQIEVERPSLAQNALYEEFCPGAKVVTPWHKRHHSPIYFATSFPQGAPIIGDNEGPTLGYTISDATTNVLFDTHYGPRSGQSGLIPIFASPGGGKSYLGGYLAYLSTLRGFQTVIIDPSGPLGRLAGMEDFRRPNGTSAARHLSMLDAAPGTFSPYTLIPEALHDEMSHVQRRAARVDSEAARRDLMADVLLLMLPDEMQNLTYTKRALGAACRQAGGRFGTNPWRPITWLQAHGEPTWADLGEQLALDADSELGRRIFPPDRSAVRVVPELATDATLTIITMQGISLPEGNGDIATTQKRLARPLMMLAIHLAEKIAYSGERKSPKTVIFDENHRMAGWPSGRAFFERVARTSRAWNVACFAMTQNPNDFQSLGRDGANLVTGWFVGQIKNDETAIDALRLAGLTTDPKTVRRLSRGEWILKLGDNAETIMVDTAHTPALHAALNTDTA